VNSVASAWAPLPNSGAGVRDLQNAAASIDPARFGVEADYLFGNTEFGNAGVGSDIDLIVVCSGDAQQRRDLHAWLEDWSLCFAEVSFQFSEQRSSRKEIECKDGDGGHLANRGRWKP
jgi:hypothetical protein